MNSQKKMESLELSPINQENYQDIEIVCKYIQNILNKYKQSSTAFQAIDIHNQNKIGFNEFRNELYNNFNIYDVNTIQNLFEMFDLDKDGFISRQDWQQSFEQYPLKQFHIEQYSISGNSQFNNIDANNNQYQQNLNYTPQKGKDYQRKNNNTPSRELIEVQNKLENSPGIDAILRKCNALKLQSHVQAAVSQYKYQHNIDNSLEFRQQQLVINNFLPPKIHQVQDKQVQQIFGEYKTPKKQYSYKGSQNDIDNSDNRLKRQQDIENSNNRLNYNDFLSGNLDARQILSQKIVSPYASKDLKQEQNKESREVGYKYEESNKRFNTPKFYPNPLFEKSSNNILELPHDQRIERILQSSSPIDTFKFYNKNYGSSLQKQNLGLSNLKREIQQKQQSFKPTKDHKNSFQSYLSVIGLGSSRNNYHFSSQCKIGISNNIQNKQSPEHQHIQPERQSGLSQLYRASTGERSAIRNTPSRTLPYQAKNISNNFNYQRRTRLDGMIDKINLQKDFLFFKKGFQVSQNQQVFKMYQNQDLQNYQSMMSTRSNASNQIKFSSINPHSYLSCNQVDIDGSVEKMPFSSIQRSANNSLNRSREIEQELKDIQLSQYQKQSFLSQKNQLNPHIPRTSSSVRPIHQGSYIPSSSSQFPSGFGQRYSSTNRFQQAERISPSQNSSQNQSLQQNIPSFNILNKPLIQPQPIIQEKITIPKYELKNEKISKQEQTLQQQNDFIPEKDNTIQNQYNQQLQSNVPFQDNDKKTNNITQKKNQILNNGTNNNKQFEKVTDEQQFKTNQQQENHNISQEQSQQLLNSDAFETYNSKNNINTQESEKFSISRKTHPNQSQKDQIQQSQSGEVQNIQQNYINQNLQSQNSAQFQSIDQEQIIFPIQELKDEHSERKGADLKQQQGIIPMQDMLTLGSNDQSQQFLSPDAFDDYYSKSNINTLESDKSPKLNYQNQKQNQLIDQSDSINQEQQIFAKQEIKNNNTQKSDIHKQKSDISPQQNNPTIVLSDQSQQFLSPDAFDDYYSKQNINTLESDKSYPIVDNQSQDKRNSVLQQQQINSIQLNEQTNSQIRVYDEIKQNNLKSQQENSNNSINQQNQQEFNSDAFEDYNSLANSKSKELIQSQSINDQPKQNLIVSNSQLQTNQIQQMQIQESIMMPIYENKNENSQRRLSNMEQQNDYIPQQDNSTNNPIQQNEQILNSDEFEDYKSKSNSNSQQFYQPPKKNLKKPKQQKSNLNQSIKFQEQVVFYQYEPNNETSYLKDSNLSQQKDQIQQKDNKINTQNQQEQQNFNSDAFEDFEKSKQDISQSIQSNQVKNEQDLQMFNSDAFDTYEKSKLNLSSSIQPPQQSNEQSQQMFNSDAFDTYEKSKMMLSQSIQSQQPNNVQNQQMLNSDAFDDYEKSKIMLSQSIKSNQAKNEQDLQMFNSDAFDDYVKSKHNLSQSIISNQQNNEQMFNSDAFDDYVKSKHNLSQSMISQQANNEQEMFNSDAFNDYVKSKSNLSQSILSQIPNNEQNNQMLNSDAFENYEKSKHNLSQSMQSHQQNNEQNLQMFSSDAFENYEKSKHNLSQSVLSHQGNNQQDVQMLNSDAFNDFEKSKSNLSQSYNQPNAKQKNNIENFEPYISESIFMPNNQQKNENPNQRNSNLQQQTDSIPNQDTQISELNLQNQQILIDALNDFDGKTNQNTQESDKSYPKINIYNQQQQILGSQQLQSSQIQQQQNQNQIYHPSDEINDNSSKNASNIQQQIDITQKDQNTTPNQQNQEEIQFDGFENFESQSNTQQSDQSQNIGNKQNQSQKISTQQPQIDNSQSIKEQNQQEDLQYELQHENQKRQSTAQQENQNIQQNEQNQMQFDAFEDFENNEEIMSLGAFEDYNDITGSQFSQQNTSYHKRKVSQNQLNQSQSMKLQESMFLSKNESKNENSQRRDTDFQQQNNILPQQDNQNSMQNDENEQIMSLGEFEDYNDITSSQVSQPRVNKKSQALQNSAALPQQIQSQSIQNQDQEQNQNQKMLSPDAFEEFDDKFNQNTQESNISYLRTNQNNMAERDQNLQSQQSQSQSSQIKGQNQQDWQPNAFEDFGEKVSSNTEETDKSYPRANQQNQNQNSSRIISNQQQNDLPQQYNPSSIPSQQNQDIMQFDAFEDFGDKSISNTQESNSSYPRANQQNKVERGQNLHSQQSQNTQSLEMQGQNQQMWSPDAFEDFGQKGNSNTQESDLSNPRAKNNQQQSGSIVQQQANQINFVSQNENNENKNSDLQQFNDFTFTPNQRNQANNPDNQEQEIMQLDAFEDFDYQDNPNSLESN